MLPASRCPIQSRNSDALAFAGLQEDSRTEPRPVAEVTKDRRPSLAGRPGFSLPRRVLIQHPCDRGRQRIGEQLVGEAARVIVGLRHPQLLASVSNTCYSDSCS